MGRDAELRGFIRHHAHTVTLFFVQLFAAALVAAFCLSVSSVAALAVMLGCACVSLPSIVAALLVYLMAERLSGRQAVLGFYVVELAKLVVTICGFLVLLRYSVLPASLLFTGFLLAYALVLISIPCFRLFRVYGEVC